MNINRKDMIEIRDFLNIEVTRERKVQEGLVV